MKNGILFVLVITLSPFFLTAQWMGISHIRGNAKCGILPNMQGKGTSFAIGFNRGFAIAATYNKFTSKAEMDMDNGTRHYELRESYFKFQVGFGYGPGHKEFNMGKIQMFGSALWGFLSGQDRLRIYHEYPDGTISYGGEQLTGVYKGLRSLTSVFSFQLGAYFAVPVGVFVGADFIRPKKRDIFEFRDENSVKYSYAAVFGGTNAMEYAGPNNTHGFNLTFGLRFGFD